MMDIAFLATCGAKNPENPPTLTPYGSEDRSGQELKMLGTVGLVAPQLTTCLMIVKKFCMETDRLTHARRLVE
jgi:hypothetical protein